GTRRRRPGSRTLPEGALLHPDPDPRFWAAWLGTLLSRERASEERYEELRVRALTGLGAEGAEVAPAPPPRPARHADRPPPLRVGRARSGGGGKPGVPGRRFQYNGAM